MKLCIVGLGLIGGSIGLGLRTFATSIVGVDAHPGHAEEALRLGLAETIASLEEGVSTADLIVLATPVNQAKVLLSKILDLMKPTAVVVDMGSTKAGICGLNAEHPKRGRFVASHPMAGTEFSGPSAAVAGLFEGKKTIICERKKSDADALALVERMYRALQMQILYYKDAEAHDRHVAYVSHISHVSSFMLGLTVLEMEKNESRILDMAGTGFASTVRLAKSSPQTWAPIFTQNKKAVSAALERYIQHLEEFKAYLDAGDEEKMKAMMTEANKIGKVIQ